MRFKDHFSGHSESYARYRPTYPSALYEFLASLVIESDLAWDCATGSGQAARGLSPYFDRVIASDASENQVKNAENPGNIEYRVFRAEDADIRDKTVDLVTVAQALHWFDFDSFYREASRVLKRDGIMAVWTYRIHEIEKEIDAIVTRFYGDVVGPFWPPERKHVESGYDTIPFPFDEIPSPEFSMELQWQLDDLLGYIESWSAVQRYKERKGENPIPLLRKELEKPWENPEKARTVRWPLTIKIGRKNRDN